MPRITMQEIGTLCRTAVPVLSLSTLLTLVACNDSPTLPPPAEELTWTAELAAEGDFDLTGSVEVDSGDSEFTASIEVVSEGEDQLYDWYVGTGAECGDFDLRIGDPEGYASLELDENGEASAEATVEEVLEAHEEYHVAVYLPGESEEEHALVACGALTLED